MSFFMCIFQRLQSTSQSQNLFNDFRLRVEVRIDFVCVLSGRDYQCVRVFRICAALATAARPARVGGEVASE